jgi:N-acetylglucosamine-6-phosphate deacetylase
MKIYQALENIEKAMRMGGYGDCILGAHLEGPYFSIQQCGAQDKTLITEPIAADYKRLIKRFGPIIKRWDYAPERDRDGEFCACLQAHGILPSAGHTDATYADMCVARENGCCLVTHLYSCTSTITREQGFRRLGVTECAYLFDDMYVEIIADGKHLPLELLQLIFKLKPHDKIILITDSVKVAGIKETYSSVGTVPCVVEDGVCKLLDRSAFAGSIATADRLIRVCLESGLTLEQAVRMGSENAARLLGISKGVLQRGYDADIVIADAEFHIKKVLIKGEEPCC